MIKKKNTDKNKDSKEKDLFKSSNARSENQKSNKFYFRKKSRDFIIDFTDKQDSIMPKDLKLKRFYKIYSNKKI